MTEQELEYYNDFLTSDLSECCEKGLFVDGRCSDCYEVSEPLTKNND